MIRKKRELTDAGVAALKPRRARYTVPDVDQRGLFIRIQPSGVRSFLAVTRDPNGKQIWTTLGRCDEIAIADARQRAREIIKRVRAGQPAIPAPPPQLQSLAAVVEGWLARHVDAKQLLSAKRIRDRLKRFIVPRLGDREFVGIKRSDIALLLDHVEDNHGTRTANQVLSDLRSIANWYAARDDDYVSPFIRGMKRGTEGKRERILTDDELRIIWTEAEKDTGQFGAIVRLLLLTAQRRAKVLTMRWDDIDANNVWHVPWQGREKQGGGDLPLPQLALDIITSQQRLNGNPYVFRAYRGTGPVTGAGMLKIAFDKRLPADLPEWTIHDLRRTARSLMSRKETGISRDVAERVLGHTIGGDVEQRYDRHGYVEEKGEALAALGALIERIVNGPPSAVW